MRLISFFFAFAFFFFYSFPAQEGNISQTASATQAPESGKISFTLLNNSKKSIPLNIPGVMRPNLSPNSSSGVTLAVGQEIFYKYKGKKRVLLVVDESYAGKELVVDELIREKKKEWNSKK